MVKQAFREICNRALQLSVFFPHYFFPASTVCCCLPIIFQDLLMQMVVKLFESMRFVSLFFDIRVIYAIQGKRACVYSTEMQNLLRNTA